jgi:hypothetical protein
MKTSSSLEGAATAAAAISPAQALWNQRDSIAALRDRFKSLSAAVARPTDLNLYQWAQISALALEFRPDLIIELGRGLGNSTCCFIEVAHRLEGASACRVLSLCLSDDWFTHTAPRLRGMVPSDWLAPAQIEVCSILDYDVEPALRRSKRCLIFWDAHGFDVAEWVLGKLMPQIVDKRHVVLMHDMSDARFEIPSPEYGEVGIWKGTNGRPPAFWLGHIFSRVAQALSIVDFTSRNAVPLHSAAESLHAEIASDLARIAELKELLGDESFSLQAHWFWFTLNEALGSLSFPQCTGLSLGIEVLEKQIMTLQKVVEEADRVLQQEMTRHQQEMTRNQQEITRLLLEKQHFESTWNTVQASLGWRLLSKWHQVRNRVAPDDSWLRKTYNLALSPLKGRSAKR